VHPKQAESLTVQRSGSTAIFESAADHDKAVDFYMFHNDPHNVTELFTSGLWLPLEMKYYTNEEDIAFWTDNEGHPKEFRTAVIDVILNHSVTTYTQRLKNITAIREVLLPAIDVIQQGNETAETVLTGLRDKVQPLLKGVYPAPFVK
jgi:multiple sugar transport system substrate-binding protein